MERNALYVLRESLLRTVDTAEAISGMATRDAPVVRRELARAQAFLPSAAARSFRDSVNPSLIEGEATVPVVGRPMRGEGDSSQGSSPAKGPAPKKVKKSVSFQE